MKDTRFPERCTGPGPAGFRRRPALTLLEVLVVLAVMGTLLAISAPSFQRTIEQAHVDLAGANLRAVWNAQRLFWLEHRTYANSVSELEELDLLDASVTLSDRYTIEISEASDAAFSAQATRIGSERWRGRFSINEKGRLTGSVRAGGKQRLTPGFQ